MFKNLTDVKNMIVAMWSGPRNISTAMMRSWGSRSDSTVIDEPFYAHYLSHTGIEHPMRDEVIGSQPNDWRQVVTNLVEYPAATSKNDLFYQKHITTHMLPHIKLDWLAGVKHCFLIRDPEQVAMSYTERRSSTVASDLGYEQQLRIYQHIQQYIESDPIVVDSARFLMNPEAQLKMICERLKLEFQPSMLSWEAGVRESDGIWQSHWYDAVIASTGFKPYAPKKKKLTTEQEELAAVCRPAYEAMKSAAI